MDNGQQIGRLHALLDRTRTDLALRQRFLADPRAVLQAEGVPLPQGAQVVALENGEKLLNLVLPPAGGDRELTDAELEGAAGGGLLALAFVGAFAAASLGVIGTGAGLGIRRLVSEPSGRGASSHGRRPLN